MSKKRFIANMVLIFAACVIGIMTMVAMMLQSISYSTGIAVIVGTLILCCGGLAWINYHYSAYGKQFSTRYPDSQHNKKS